jgi:peptidoglycan DL-endopeptidase CwlO
VASHRMKIAMRGALAVTAVAVVVGMNPSSAVADPPANTQDALKQLNDASKAAEQAQQAFLAANDDLTAKRGARDAATHDIEIFQQQLASAQAQEEVFRGQVDKLAAATYNGAQFTQLSALLTGESAQDFLDQSSALQMVAARNVDVLNTYDAAVTKAADAKAKASDAQKLAQSAKDAAAKILADLDQKKQAAVKAAADAKTALSKLSAADRKALGGDGDLGSFIGPAGAAGVAMQAALAQRGTPYVWGGEAPGSGFDCSGLTQYAYRLAGIGIPRSAAAQYGVGKSVSRDELVPGDLVFFGTSASNIYHVAMYVGNGMVVHAPTEGQNVKVVPVSHAGSGYFGAKRMVG